MDSFVLPIILFFLFSTALAVGMLVVPWLLAPKRTSPVKQMPYESGMDPIHNARRRFDIRFHLVAIAFLIFDVELLFLYPWAVATRAEDGIDAAVRDGLVDSRLLVFGAVMFFFALLVLGLVYEWRKGVLRWR